ncbi:tumor necrosis factor receptor superfamily member 6B-like isoform X1 [Seriola aureovittata]|uniref:tumor necrosis factor receptor superfamily member 6B-like isoform X1 n=1 Tax=Seriola aureovittata TaxID=2871759 RepID=UPI0024BF08C9|nr:tumor necrosis factor receptor superfamily member 6B-like isoform X1 [Seriola aureovittata]
MSLCFLVFSCFYDISPCFIVVLYFTVVPRITVFPPFLSWCPPSFQMLFPLLSLMLLSVCTAGVGSVAAPVLTFKQTDPVTGMQLECDRCPPGTFLRTRCTSTHKSECAPCPKGSFTELWNHIEKCLRCDVCGHNQVVKAACSADSNCQCECKQGYYYKTKYEMCIRHSECPSGQGVLSIGTANADTVCHICPDGTYSEDVSAVLSCAEHMSCDAAGLVVALKGSSWHDSVCVSCGDLRATDGANYLKDIIPAFFLHHKMSIKRLRRLVHNLPSEDGKKQEGTSTLSFSDANVRINMWVASATAKQIRQLPAILMKVGANNIGERLQNKLHRIDSNLKELCTFGNEVVIIVSE